MVSRLAFPEPALGPDELRRRAGRVRLVITDCDGVLTDAGVYYTARGELARRFSLRDGMGVERLRQQGIATAIVSGELSLSIRRRAEKLKIEGCYLGVGNKEALLERILDEHGVSLAEVACIGDDLNDRGLFERIGAVGLSGAPADAMPELLALAHFQCNRMGGHGAFREFAEWILALRGEPNLGRAGTGRTGNTGSATNVRGVGSNRNESR